MDLPEGASSFLSNRAVASPDGRYISFAHWIGGEPRLSVRPIDSLSSRELPGTEGVRFHFWSPDSRFIAFFAGDELKKVEVGGGPPQLICSVHAFGPFNLGTWGANDVILFNVLESPEHRGLYRVPGSGGTATRLPIVGPAGEEILPLWPALLPDGRHFLFRGARVVGDGKVEDAGIMLGSLDSERAEPFLDINSYFEYAPPGYLLYVTAGNLLALPFDANELRVEGDPIRVAAGVSQHGPSGWAAFSASKSGILVYEMSEPLGRLVRRDRSGAVRGEVGPVARYGRLRISPDGKELAAAVEDAEGSENIWIFDMERDVATRFTSLALAETPVWSPEGNRVAFAAGVGGPPFLHIQDRSGTEAIPLVPLPGTVQWPSDWSPDGRFLLFEERRPGTDWDLLVLPVEEGGEAVPFVQTPFREGEGAFSPDGNWVSYVSDESGYHEVYVQPFPGPGEKRRVSPDGGNRPRWSRDGTRLFYVSADDVLMAVPLERGEGLGLGMPEPLFSVGTASYDVTPDGGVIHGPEVGERVRYAVVLDWATGLER
jgi:Tol biopolymer transport system component